jgi:beta-mannosidase
MLNDCWPAASGWALIDYNLTPKASYYSFARCSKPLVLSLDREDGKFNAYVSSNELIERHIKLYINEINLKDGSAREIYSGENIIPANSSEVAASFIYDFPRNTFLCGEIVSDNGRDRAFYKIGVPNIKRAKIKYSYDTASGEVIVASDSYIHAVELEGIDTGTLFTDNYFSLMPGEERKIKVIGEKPKALTVTAYTLK